MVAALRGPPGEWRGLGAQVSQRHLIVWQFCIHTSTAGEAVTMISRSLSKKEI